MDEDEIMQEIERRSLDQQRRTRAMLYGAGRPDLVAELDRNLKEVRTGTSRARSIWHSISPKQRAVLETMRGGRWLVRSGDTRWYDAKGTDGTVRKVCDIRTVRCLTARNLCQVNGGAFDPESKVVLTEHGLFVLRLGRGEAG